MDALIPWLAVAFALVFAYPWARWLLDLPYPFDRPRPRQPVLVTLLTIGLSVGALAWIELILSGLSPGLVAFWPVTAACALTSAAGWLLWWRRARRPLVYAVETLMPGPAGVTWWRERRVLVVLAIIVILLGLALLNAALWPFFADDVMTLYGPIGYRFAQNGQFGGLGLYDAYPVLVPLSYAYPQLANGGPHEYAARVITTALALAAVGAAFALGRELYGPATPSRPPPLAGEERGARQGNRGTPNMLRVAALQRGRTVGLMAAFLTIATPTLIQWASTGYTDLPAATYYTLAVLFAWRLFVAPHPVYAILTGLLAGLAVFTKNGAWLLVGSLAGWVVYTHWWGRAGHRQGINSLAGATSGSLAKSTSVDSDGMHAASAGEFIPRHNQQTGQPIAWRHVLWMVGAFLLVAGPWYGHTLLAYGTLIPPTGWTDQAARTLPTLLGIATRTRDYLLTGVLGGIGLGLVVWQVWRARWHFAPRAALLAGFTGPFLVVWWLFFSYDPRFLMLIWPLWSILGAAALWTGYERLDRGNRWGLRRWAWVLVILLAIPAAFVAVDNKWDLLRDPFMSDDARHRVQLGGRWDVILWLREHAEPEARVLVSDYRFAYHLWQSQPDFGLSWPQTADDLHGADDLRGYDFWILTPGEALPTWADADLVREVYAVGDYVVLAMSAPN